MNLYEYVKSSPGGYVDIGGTAATSPAPPGGQPSAPKDPVPEWDKEAKKDGGKTYVEWRESLGSPWDQLATGQLKDCPKRIRMPDFLESALRKSLRLTLQVPEDKRREYSGALVFHRDDRLNAIRNKKTGSRDPYWQIRHRAYGPYPGTATSSEPESSLPLRFSGFWQFYGAYHTHIPDLDTPFSRADVLGFLGGQQKYGGRMISVARSCACTRALVRLSATPSYTQLQKDLAKWDYTGWIRPKVPAAHLAARQTFLEAIDQDLANFAAAHRFCFYKTCGPNQQTLEHQPGKGGP